MSTLILSRHHPKSELKRLPYVILQIVWWSSSSRISAFQVPSNKAFPASLIENVSRILNPSRKGPKTVSGPSRTSLLLIKHSLPEEERYHLAPMFGDPVRAIMESQGSPQSKPNPETLKLIQAVLDYIRSNLNNIKSTWGVDSPQYKSAAEIMEQSLDANLKRLNVEKSDIEELMQQIQGMNLEDKPKIGN